MEIQIKKEICELLRESVYNHNYYLLPDGILIDSHSVIYEICDEEYDSYMYILGDMNEVPFEDDSDHTRIPSNYGFDQCKDYIVIDTTRIGQYNT